MPPLARKALAEFVGTTLLLIAVVGSGIAAERLSPHDGGLQLLESAVATGAALVAIITAFGAVSGAHLNPVISAADAVLGGLRRDETAAYVAAQVAGAVTGAVLANLMFSLPAVTVSAHQRSGSGLWLGEVIATAGLLFVVLGAVRSGRSAAVAYAVGAYIGGAYVFTSSTSFANPAATIARTLSDTFAGIAPGSAAMFIACQIAGGALACVLARLLWPSLAAVAPRVVLPDAGSDVA